MTINKWIALLSITYFWTSFLLYCFGPIHYYDDNRFSIAVFLLFVSLFFYWGCVSINIKRVEFYYPININYSYLNYFIYISIILSVILIFDKVINYGFNLSLNLGNVYIDSHIKDEDISVSRIGQLSVLFSPIRVMSFSLGAYKFLSSTRKIRIIIVTNFLLYIFFEVLFIGTQKGLGNLIIVILFSFFLYLLQANLLSKIYKYFIYFIAFFLVFFIVSQISRMTAYGGSGLENSYYFEYNRSEFFSYFLPDSVIDGFVLFIFYISHGYHGLGYCLQMPFEWTYFYGSSFALNSYLTQYFGFPDMLEFSYPSRMEELYGWPGFMFWPTAFSWIASDLSFVGVIFTMFFLGRFSCILFKEAYYFSSPLSIALFSYITILLIYLPANNQIFQTRESFIGFFSLLLFWIINKIKFR